MENRMIANPLASAIATQLISTPHPVTLEGSKNIFAAMQPGETLEHFMRRNVENFDSTDWLVSVGGVEIPRHLWRYVMPKEGQIIEMTGNPGRSALFMIAIIVLTIYTGGLAAAVLAGAGGAFGLGAVGTFLALTGIAAIQYAGTLLINKVLGPKVQSNKGAAGIQQYQNYSLTNPNNSAKTYQAVPLLFGTYMVAPDYLSKPYSWFSDNDQYLALNLSWGIGVDHYDELYLGTTKLSTYLDDTKTWNRGFSGVADDTIPLFGNVDTQDGGPLQDDSGALLTVSRTSSVNTVRVGWDFQWSTYSLDGKGRMVGNADAVQCYIRLVGAPNWVLFTQQSFSGNSTKVYRRTIYADVAPGQYETKCVRMGQSSTDSNAVCQITLSTLTSIQQDTSTYAGIARTGIQMRASSQLNGTPDQINAVAYSTPIPVWDGTAWTNQTSSNPGAQMLKYLRGYFDATGKLIAGCGYGDEQIDVPAYQAFMLYCAAQGFTYDNWVTEDRTHLTMLEALAQAGMGEYTDAMGLHSVIWIAEDQPVDAIVNMSRVQKDSFSVNYTVLGTSDGIVATYVDKTVQPWAETTMQVPSPVSGTTTITNPANVTLEGVTNVAHAAKLARLLMAQQVYQYKGVDYNTSFEWLTYKRYSLVQMQHDLTQWGYGGNVLGATIDASNKVTLQLDEEVPAPTTGNAYIGLRIPGEAGYRVFTINPFAGTSDTLTLSEAWPSDAALPGSDDVANPAYDTLWIYDFKQTPGLACRVISVQPQAGFKGATISVVPESDEFWQYVSTGAYTPPKNGSLIPQRPVASNLVLTEQLQTIGNVSQPVMNASFAVSGLCGDVLVYCDMDVQGVMQLVASLKQERNASWPVDANRQYTVTVRPFTQDGSAGIPVTNSYTPALPNMPPPNIDYFNIVDKGDGMRTYSWGFNPSTNLPPNLAGVEIRYIAGSVGAPDWTAMSDLAAGSTPSYFTSAVNSSVPEGGTYTFAVRTVNTDGVLSAVALFTHVTLSDSIEKIQQDAIAGIAAAQAAAQQAQTDTDTALAQVQQEVTDRTTAVLAEANARATAILNEQNTRAAAISAEQTTRQTADDSLATQISLVSAGSGEQFDSAKIWYFDSDLESWSGSPSAPTIVDGWLRPANGAGTSTVWSPYGLGIDGSSYRFVKARIKKVGNPAWTGNLYWRKSGDGANPVGQMVSLPQPSFDANGVTAIAWQDIPWWPNTIDSIRLDIGNTQTATDYYLIDWVAIGRPTPGAGVALVQQETSARVLADSQEATQRTTLATQMRGAYTGTDVAGVTSGLVYSEAQARSGADGALAARASALEARMPAGTGSLATASSVTDEAAARANADNAEATARQQLASTVNDPTTGLGSKASVSSLNTTNSNLSTLSGTVTSQGTSITAVQAVIPSGASGSNQLATSSALNSLSGTVTQQGQAITANQQAITGVQGSVGTVNSRVDTEAAARQAADAANASAITTVQAATSAPAINYCANPNGDDGTNGWGKLTGAATLSTSAWTNGNILIITGGADGSDSVFEYSVPNGAAQYSPWCAGGEITVNGLTAGSYFVIALVFYNAAGTALALTQAANLTAGTTASRSSYYAANAAPPAGAVRVALRIILHGATTAGQNISIRGVKIEASAKPTAFTQDATIKATASATTQLTAGTTINGAAFAAATTMVDANGRIGGTRLASDGTISSFTVLADQFAVVAPAGGASTVYSGGNWRVYDASGTLRVRMGVW